MIKLAMILLPVFLIPFLLKAEEISDGHDPHDQRMLIDSLVKIADKSMESDPANAFFYARQALHFAESIHYQKGRNEALLSISRYYRTREDYVNMLDYYFRITDLAERNHDTTTLINTYSLISRFFMMTKDRELARKYLDRVENIASTSSNEVVLGQVNVVNAQYLIDIEDYDAAIRHLYLGLYHFQKSNDQKAEAFVYKYLGDTYLQKEQHCRARFYYDQAAKILIEIGDPAELAVIDTRIAHLYQVLEENDMGLYYNLAALRIRMKYGQPKMIASSLMNVGGMYRLTGKSDSATLYYEKARQMAEAVRASELLEAIYWQLSRFAKARGRDEEALRYFVKCAEYRAKMNMDRSRTEIALLEANRSIRSSELKIGILNQEVQIQELQIRNRKIQIFLLEVGFLFLLAMVIVADLMARRNRKRRNELKDLNDRLSIEIRIRADAEEALKASEERHRFLAEHTMDVISLLDQSLRRRYISPSCEKVYGFSVEEVVGMKDPVELVAPEFKEYVSGHLAWILENRKPSRFMYKIQRKDGTTFWAEANINPILDPETNQVASLISVVRDISERMAYEEELARNGRQKEYLLHEIHNRVKNNFAILVSLMNMQREQSGNTVLTGALTELQLRVRTMSLVHEQLYKTQEISSIPFDKYLHHLLMTISGSYNNPRVRIRTEIKPCHVGIEMALPLGLITNELITNAFKYAFPGDRAGNIRIGLHPVGENQFCLTISDDGIGLPENFSMGKTQTMGTQIIGILVEQIEASMEISNDAGATFRIRFSTKQQ